MKIQYASDLHLELSGNSKYVKEIPFEVTGDILVLAGDTVYYGTRIFQTASSGNGLRRIIVRYF